MKRNGVEENKHTPEEWAIQNYKTDTKFWDKCQQEGSGLIKKLAVFVVKHGQGAQT